MGKVIVGGEEEYMPGPYSGNPTKAATKEMEKTLVKDHFVLRDFTTLSLGTV